MLEEFKVNLRKVHEEYKQSENFATKLRNYYLKKLDKQENTHEDEVQELKLQQYDEHDKLRNEVQKKQKELRIIGSDHIQSPRRIAW